MRAIAFVTGLNLVRENVVPLGTHDGRVERVCSAPVTTYGTKLGERFSALVSHFDVPDGLHVVVIVQQGVRKKAAVEWFETVLAAGQSAAFSIPLGASEVPERVELTNAGGQLQIAEPLLSFHSIEAVDVMRCLSGASTVEVREKCL